MARFEDRWSRPPQPGIAEKINDTIKPKGPLKPQVSAAIKRLQAQISKMDAMLEKLQQRDAKIFQRIVEATSKNDVNASRVLSAELAEVRKVTKTLGSARMALDRIELRLATYHDLGDTVTTIMPTIGLMKNMKSSLAKFMPGADKELSQMSEMLGGFMMDGLAGDGMFANETAGGEEAEAILKEAAAVAEASIGGKFPNVPTQTADTESKFLG